MSEYHYRITLVIAGGTQFHICTVESPEAVGSVIAALCRAEQPQFTQLLVELCPPAPVR